MYKDIFNSEQEVMFWSELWGSKAKVIKQITDYCTVQYCNNQEFSKGEFEAYRKGIADFGAFISGCAKEVLIKRELEKVKKPLDTDL